MPVIAWMQTVWTLYYVHHCKCVINGPRMSLGMQNDKLWTTTQPSYDPCQREWVCVCASFKQYPTLHEIVCHESTKTHFNRTNKRSADYALGRSCSLCVRESEPAAENRTDYSMDGMEWEIKHMLHFVLHWAHRLRPFRIDLRYERMFLTEMLAKSFRSNAKITQTATGRHCSQSPVSAPQVHR